MTMYPPGSATMLRDVRRRAEPVLTLLDLAVWPEAELRTLTRFLHAHVLTQAADEESLLARGVAAPYAELTDEHVALHMLTDRLDEAPPGPGCRADRVDLARVVHQLLDTLDHHLRAERAVFAALPPIDQLTSSDSAVADGGSARVPVDSLR